MIQDPNTGKPKVRVQIARTVFPKKRSDGNSVLFGALLGPLVAFLSGLLSVALFNERWWVQSTSALFVAVSIVFAVLRFPYLAVGLYLGLLIFMGLVVLLIMGLCGDWSL